MSVSERTLDRTPVHPIVFRRSAGLIAMYQGQAPIFIFHRKTLHREETCSVLNIVHS